MSLSCSTAACCDQRGATGKQRQLNLRHGGDTDSVQRLRSTRLQLLCLAQSGSPFFHMSSKLPQRVRSSELGRPRQWRQPQSPTALSRHHRNLIYSTPPPEPGDAGNVLEKGSGAVAW